MVVVVVLSPRSLRGLLCGASMTDSAWCPRAWGWTYPDCGLSALLDGADLLLESVCSAPLPRRRLPSCCLALISSSPRAHAAAPSAPRRACKVKVVLALLVEVDVALQSKTKGLHKNEQKGEKGPVIQK